MRLPRFITKRLWHAALNTACSREPDVIIGENYLRRWHVIPRNKFFNIYLHHFIGSDDDRALHCHPWANLSCLINGRYLEHTIAAGGTGYRKEYKEGNLKLRNGEYAHRVELFPGETCWTLFITGPKYREWFFHCKKKMVHWMDFTNADDPSKVGKGCGEYD